MLAKLELRLESFSVDKYMPKYRHPLANTSMDKQSPIRISSKNAKLPFTMNYSKKKTTLPFNTALSIKKVSYLQAQKATTTSVRKVSPSFISSGYKTPRDGVEEMQVNKKINKLTLQN